MKTPSPSGLRDSHGHLHSEHAAQWVDALAERMGANGVVKASLTGVTWAFWTVPEAALLSKVRVWVPMAV